MPTPYPWSQPPLRAADLGALPGAVALVAGRQRHLDVLTNRALDRMLGAGGVTIEVPWDDEGDAGELEPPG